MNDYLNLIVEKFNTDCEDPSLTEFEKAMLQKIMEVEKSAAQLLEGIEKLNKEINNKQQELGIIHQNVINLKGQSKGLKDALLVARDTTV